MTHRVNVMLSVSLNRKQSCFPMTVTGSILFPIQAMVGGIIVVLEETGVDGRLTSGMGEGEIWDKRWLRPEVERLGFVLEDMTDVFMKKERTRREMVVAF